MSPARRIVILHDRSPAPAELEALAEALRREGARIVVHGPDDGDDDVLDDIGECDSVVCWK